MATPPKIAYLITAYNDPIQLGSLLQELLRSGAGIYIHIDANVDISPFKETAPKSDNIVFLDERIAVNWMGFSQVQSLLALLQMANVEGYEHYVFLSGSDYPIKSHDYIIDFYSVRDKDYISFWKLADRPSWLDKVAYFYPIDLVRIREYIKGIEKSYWRRLFWGRFYRYLKYFPKRKFLRGLTPYGGSDWCSLSHKSASYILSYVKANPKYVRFFRYTHCPSELFFHTILLNSERAHHAHG